jgi:DNA polymerase-4
MGRSADLPRESGQTDGDDSASPILHVDMDAFFASVEIRRRPELRGRPVIVGGGHRGVVSAASYEARRYGVRSAMPMSVALRNCPAAVVLPVDRAAYVQASRAVMAIFADVTPAVEPLSLDEAFLDVSSARRLLGRPADIARHIRARVFDEERLTCSVGIASTKFVAKVASARCKPDGMLVVPASGVLDFLHPLPITALWGVGPSTAARLARLGLRTVGEVAATPRDVLRRSVGAGTADHLGALARGEDPRSVQTEHVEKSISSDRTFDVDLSAATDVERELLRLAQEVGRRVRERGMLSRTVGIKVRYADFRTISRTRTLAEPTDNSTQIYESALALCRSLAHDQPRIRLLGVKAESLSAAHDTARQLSLDDVLGSQPEPPSALDQIADLARQRFGAGALQPGTLIRPPGSASGLH